MQEIAIFAGDCNICLEDLADTDLVTHLLCSGIICRDCLDRSIKHSSESRQKCPICLEDCLKSEWVQLDQYEVKLYANLFLAMSPPLP